VDERVTEVGGRKIADAGAFLFAVSIMLVLSSRGGLTVSSPLFIVFLQ
jgi:hypothetical protein